MSGWDGMVRNEIAHLPHPELAWAFEDWKGKRRYHEGPVARTSFMAGGEWVLKRLGEWESLTEADAISELRKGEQSVFYVLFGADPRITVDCPRDGRVVIGPEGYCDTCGKDFSA